MLRARRKNRNISFIVYWLTQRGLEPIINHTRGLYVKHYNTDALNTYQKLLTKYIARTIPAAYPTTTSVQ